MASKYVNILTPPVGTSFFRYQDAQPVQAALVPVDGSGTEYANINWNVQVYTYVTGARPDDPEFTSKGGMVYIVIVHDGSVTINNDNVKGWKKLQLSVLTNLLTPVAQLPNNGKQAEDDWSYEIEFKQALSMFNNGGNAAFTFNAEYQQDWIRTNIQQKGLIENTACRMPWFRTPDDAEISEPQQIAGLSVYRINRIPTSNVIVGFIATMEGDNVVANQVQGSFVLPMSFSA